MLSVIGRRLALSLPLLVIVPTVTFLLAALIPGDVARTILGADASQAQYLQLRQSLGLNEPLLTRYLTWLGNALHGNLGTSLFWQQPVAALLDSRWRSRFPRDRLDRGRHGHRRAARRRGGAPGGRRRPSPWTPSRSSAWPSPTSSSGCCSSPGSR